MTIAITNNAGETYGAPATMADVAATAFAELDEIDVFEASRIVREEWPFEIKSLEHFSAARTLRVVFVDGSQLRVRVSRG